MALLTSTSGAGGWTPQQYGEVVLAPAQKVSVALRVANLVRTGSTVYRVPVLDADANASWVPEGAEITPDDPDLRTIDVTPKKVAALVPISNEMADDSDPSMVDQVGDSVGRSLAVKIDQAFFGNTTTNGPDGLGHYAVNEVDAGSDWTNLDAFAEALGNAEEQGEADHVSFIANAETALALGVLKTGTDSNQPLLQPDPTQAGRRVILGSGLYVNPNVADDTVWAVPYGLVTAVLRKDVEVTFSKDAGFTKDSTLVRAIARVGFAVPVPGAISRITVGA